VTDHRDQITIRHLGPLQGTIRVPGAKNAVLKLMAASLLADGEYELTNVPAINDVAIMGELLAAVGMRSHRRDRAV
jgi:UDP-N-acetylglucosamine 1-carboxyvinyltransferase